MKSLNEYKKKLKTGSEGSSLAIALFFFMLCALICAGILYVANSSIFGVTKHFNDKDVPEYVMPPIPTVDVTPTPTLDPAHEEESEAIKYVYDTLSYEFDEMFETISKGGDYSILHSSNPRSLSYEIMSYINAYFGVVYRSGKSIKLSDTEINPSDLYYVETDENGEMLPKEFTVTVKGYIVKVVVELSGNTDSNGNKTVYNTLLIFNSVKFTVSAIDGSDCQYVRTYDKTYEDGYFYLKWVGAGSGLPKRFVIKNKKW